MLRIGITQRVEDLPDRGERRDCLDQAWTPLLDDIGIQPVPIPNRLRDVAGFVTAHDLVGVILSGGNDLADLPGAENPAPERDACEHTLLDLSSESGLPLLGVCRGLQILACHYGAELGRVDGHRATRHVVEVVDAGPLHLQGRDAVNSFHDWGLPRDRVPGDLRVAAIAPDGTVEALYHPRKRQAALMWHPERDPFDPHDAELIRAFFEAGR